MSLEFFLATRYLKARRKEKFISLITFLSITGIAIGVMALVIVIAVMSGAETEFRKRILGLEPHILIMNNYSYDYKEVINQSKSIKGIKAVSPIVFAQSILKTSNSFSGIVVRGVDPECNFNMIKGFNAKEQKNKLTMAEKNGKLPGIILGKEIAEKNLLIKGDNIILMSPMGMISPVGHIPSFKRFQVTGIFESGIFEYDNTIAYVHFNEAQKLMNMKNKISALGIWINDVFSAGSIKESILLSLESSFYGKDWMDINKSIFSALKLEKTVMFIILILIVFVAAFNIASTLIMMVMEKIKDIAVLKAMGATDKIIRKIFIIQGMIIGSLGTFIGTILGVIICMFLKKYNFIQLPKVYPFSTLPVQLESLDVLIIAVSSIIISYLSTIYPSYRAAKMNPVEALRYG